MRMTLWSTSTLAAVALLACGAPPSSDDGTQEVSSALSAEAQDDDHGLGLLVFGEERFNQKLHKGNGRACATCHVAGDNFMLRAESVEERYRQLPRKQDGTIDFAKDPLFNAIDANDFAEDFTNLRKGLIRVTLPLPRNITIDELPGATEISVWRKVPSVKDVALTAPYQVDMRAATLQIQALGAAQAHSQVSVDPTQKTLDALAFFQLNQFSNDRSRDISAAIANGTQPPSSFPTDLNEQEQRGQVVYNRACLGCHTGPGLDGFTPAVGRKKHNVVSSVTGATPNVHGLPTYTIRCKNPDNTVVTRFRRPDPGIALITGICADIGRFESTTLFGIANRAPYFHDGSVKTLEGVIDVYNAGLFTIPPAAALFSPPLNAVDKADVVAFVKRL